MSTHTAASNPAALAMTVAAATGAAGVGLFVTVAALLALLTLPFTASATTAPHTMGVIADIPPAYLALYTAAEATCPHLDWSVLAAVGKVESDHGRSHAPGVHSGSNVAGAMGPMQFMPATFAAVTARHQLPPGGARPLSPYNPHDAVFAAAAYLCDSGAAAGELRAALYAYNHADWYVNEVIAIARGYAATAARTPNSLTNPATNPATNPGASLASYSAQLAATTPDGRPRAPAALVALSYAHAQLGVRYQWGGNGPAVGQGFDCSGLTQRAWAAAGITLPRTAETQFYAGPAVPVGAPLAPGDLVFFHTHRGIGHVALYIGGGQVIEAPDVGLSVRVAPLGRVGYLGATPPAATTPPPHTP
jgi:cell wall-associated NlpC family hydrolase